MSVHNTTYAKATLEAMAEEMERDASVFLMGEDIAKVGGVLGQFKGLAERFGPERVRDTPISEAVLVSSAIGAALAGQRPVVDMHFADFVTCSMDELVNQAAKLSYMFGGQASVPLVIRVPEGTAHGAAAQHSQSLEAFMCHCPGWRVVSPSNPADAKGLLKAAIRCNDPVLYCEHKGLYSSKGDIPDGDHVVPIGDAAVRHAGDDVTIISWSRSLLRCLEAAAQLADQGIDAEVIDARTLAPLDLATMTSSVSRTGRAVVVHEAVRTCGVGAEIAAALQELCYEDLKAPILRVANPGVPIPFAPTLEDACIPQTDDVVAAAEKVMAMEEARVG